MSDIVVGMALAAIGAASSLEIATKVPPTTEMFLDLFLIPERK